MMMLDKEILKKIIQLREKTGAKVIHCKEAITVCKGDEKEAEEWLSQNYPFEEKKGSIKQEGIVAFKTNILRNHAAGIKITCSTDFVSSNDVFVLFAKKILSSSIVYMERNKKATVDNFINDYIIDNKKLQDNIDVLSNKLGEKISVDIKFFNTSHLFIPYNHFNLRRASLVEYSYIATPGNSDKAINMHLTKDTIFANNLDKVARDIAIHSLSIPANEVSSVDDILKYDSMLEDVDNIQDYIHDNIKILNISRMFI